MSSILDALKKLEEEKQRQLKLLEKEEEEEQDSIEPVSISTIAKTEVVQPIPESTTQLLSPKFLIIGVILLVLVVSVVSITSSIWIVKTQIAKNTIPTPPAETVVSIQQPVETTAQTPVEEKTPSEPVTAENRIEQTASPPQEIRKEQTGKENITETNFTPPINIPPAKVEKTPDVKVNNTATTIEQPVITNPPPTQIAKNTPTEPKPITEEIKTEPTISPPESEVVNEIPQESIISPASTEPPPQPQNLPTEKQNTTTDTQSQTSSATNPSTPPKVVTRDLEPPPSLKPEQFQQVLPIPKPKLEEPVDMTRLPVLRTSDRSRLGLEDMKLNVLREAGPNNPHGLAIINLTKVYVGEMIPGTSVRLLDVKTHGIAIEVVGTGERYYVPR